MTAPRRTPHFIVLAAGGTGGHVFPAEALAQELLAQGHRLALITDKRGSAYGGTLGAIETHHVSGQGITGRGFAGVIKGLFMLGRGLLQARVLLQRLKPDVVVGFGGYAAAPSVGAALHLGIPTVIHEQNAVLGRANRLLARRVNYVCTSFDLARRPAKDAQIIRTGMPVRPAIVAMSYAAYAKPDITGPFRILVLGGSQGARVFSDVLPAAVKLLPLELRRRLEISQQCRPEDLDRAHQAYVGSDAHVQLRHFFDNVPELLAASHLLIARSGASTVAELSVAGRPALLVPYPYAADDHQTANAKALEAHQGGWVIPQSNFTPPALAARLAEVMTRPDLLSATAKGAADFAIPDAAHRLAHVVVSAIPGQNGARTAIGAAAVPTKINNITKGAA